jgi:hypothetical protein
MELLIRFKKLNFLQKEKYEYLIRKTTQIIGRIA